MSPAARTKTADLDKGLPEFDYPSIKAFAARDASGFIGLRPRKLSLG
jgi:hypothetical protein